MQPSEAHKLFRMTREDEHWLMENSVDQKSCEESFTTMGNKLGFDPRTVYPVDTYSYSSFWAIPI